MRLDLTTFKSLLIVIIIEVSKILWTTVHHTFWRESCVYEINKNLSNSCQNYPSDPTLFQTYPPDLLLKLYYSLTNSNQGGSELTSFSKHTNTSIFSCHLTPSKFSISMNKKDPSPVTICRPPSSLAVLPGPSGMRSDDGYRFQPFTDWLPIDTTIYGSSKIESNHTTNHSTFLFDIYLTRIYHENPILTQFTLLFLSVILYDTTLIIRDHDLHRDWLPNLEIPNISMDILGQ